MPGLPKSIIKKYGISKKAWSVFRGRRRGSPRTRSVKSLARYRRYPRRRSYRPWRRRRGRGKRTIPILPLATIGGIVYYHGKRALDSGWGIDGAVDQIQCRFTGFSFKNPQMGFQPSWMMEGLVPVVISVLAHKAMNWLGVNRMFNKLPSPLNKLRL